MEAPNRVSVCSEFNTERSGDNLLEHGEGKDIVRQTKECVVGSHIYESMQTAATNHELHRTRTWNILVTLYDVGRIEQLDDGLARVRLLSEAGNNIGDLIVSSHAKQSRAVCTIECATIIRELVVLLYVVADVPEIVCLRQVPQELPQAAK